jgi:alpha-ribazole phosphatase/probable phosphoglycerate mutase
MVEIYFTRHGLTESNKKNIYMGDSEEGLAPDGVIQAESLARSLQDLRLGSIFSSPMKRALETAKIIGDILDLPVEFVNELAEMRLGPWKGLTEEEVSRQYPEDYLLWNTRPADLVLPDRETLGEVQQRIIKAIDQIKERSRNFPVLAVTHVTPIRSLIIYYQRLHINVYRTINIPNLSVFRLQLDGAKVSISRFL